MFKTLLKSSFALLAFSLSGCSLYMAPWEKPNPYHYETLPPAPEIIYVPTPRSDLQFGTVPPEAMPPKTYYEEKNSKKGVLHLQIFKIDNITIQHLFNITILEQLILMSKIIMNPILTQQNL